MLLKLDSAEKLFSPLAGASCSRLANDHPADSNDYSGLRLLHARRLPIAKRGARERSTGGGARGIAVCVTLGRGGRRAVGYTSFGKSALDCREAKVCKQTLISESKYSAFFEIHKMQ